jgi:HSP20 family protein
MAIRDLTLRRKGDALAVRHGEDAWDQFHREIDRVFAGFFGDLGLGLPARWEELRGDAGWPRVNVAESDRDIVVTAELPGVDEKNVKVELDEDAVVLRGEVCEEQEEKGRRWTRFERRCGSFDRTVPLPAAVDPERAKATFKRGLLTVTLPKREPDRRSRKVVRVQAEA